MMTWDGLKRACRLSSGLAVLLVLALTTPVEAFQFTLGDVDASLDTTLSYGASWRTRHQDEAIIGLANGGKAYSVNGDDGDLNYDKQKLISNVFKITSDLELRYLDFGAFLRGSAFYDIENEDNDRERTELSNSALKLVGKSADLLDAYVWWNFDIGQALGQIRAGNQVLSWGESTFIHNSINTINPVDVSKLRVPGAELKEALLPVGMVSASVSPNEYLTLEGYYQYDWEATEIDPTGTFWSTNDFAGKGGNRVVLGFGDWSDLGTSWQGLVLPMEVTDDRFMMVPRGETRYADNDNQFGIALRVFAPGLNDTEFGFYYLQYNSQLPVVSGRTGTPVGVASSVTAGTTIGAIAAGADIPSAIAAGTSAGVTAGLPVADAQTIATGGANAATAVLTGSPATLPSAYVVNEYAQTAEYIIEYPDDIQLLGVSFNTSLDSIGASLQGEYSYRIDAPLQVDDVELLLAALTPLGDLNPAFLDNQITNGDKAGLVTYIPGYIEKDVSQIQMTLTKIFGPTVGADQFTLVGEAGMTYVHDMPSKNKLRLEGPGTYTSGNPTQAELPGTDPALPLGGVHAGKPAENSDDFADSTSWGYRLVGKLDYNNAIGPVTLSPRVAWAHDVSGISPGPGGNFVEGRKAVTFGLGADYLKTWSTDVSYTNYFGAGRHNLLTDRDFIAFNIKYSF